MPTRVPKVVRKANRTLPVVVQMRGQEITAEINPPSSNLGENMPKPDSKGKIPADESGELIVWDNRQRTS